MARLIGTDIPQAGYSTVGGEPGDSDTAAQLFELPVEFGPSKASEISSDRATIDYEIR